MHAPEMGRTARWVAIGAVAVVGSAATAAVVVDHRGGSGANPPRAATSPGRPAIAAQSTAPSRHPAARWLVRTNGRPPTVAEENRVRGTAAWRLPARDRERYSGLDGYVSDPEPHPGERLRVFVSARDSRWVRIRIFRMGWYHGAEGRLVLATNRLPTAAQPPCSHDDRTGATVCHWRPTLRLRLPPALPSGAYLVRMDDAGGDARDTVFVLGEAPGAPRAPMLAVLPTATWQAYNQWGGDSLYPGGRPVAATHSDQGVEVSEDRPYDGATGAGQLLLHEISAVRFLERFGEPVAYTGAATLAARPDVTAGRRAILDLGHSEYWSQRQADALRRARDHGTSLVFLSSDTGAWRVRYAGHVIVGWKDFAAGAARPDDRRTTFSDGLVGLVGSRYERCITPRIGRRSAQLWHYFPWHPDPRLRPRWLFRDTGLTATSTVVNIVGYEVDVAAPGHPRGETTVGGGLTQCQRHLPSQPAATTLYQAPSGALVFATGTLGWQFGLSPDERNSPDTPDHPDRRLVRLTRNLLARVAHRPPPRYTGPLPGAPAGPPPVDPLVPLHDPSLLEGRDDESQPVAPPP